MPAFPYHSEYYMPETQSGPVRGVGMAGAAAENIIILVLFIAGNSYYNNRSMVNSQYNSLYLIIEYCS